MYRAKNAFDNTENRRVCLALIPAELMAVLHCAWLARDISLLIALTEKRIRQRESARTWLKWNANSSLAGTLMPTARGGATRRPHSIVGLHQLSFISTSTQWNLNRTQLITAMFQTRLYNKRFCSVEPSTRSFLETIRRTYGLIGNTTTHLSAGLEAAPEKLLKLHASMPNSVEVHTNLPRRWGRKRNWTWQPVTPKIQKCGKSSQSPAGNRGELGRQYKSYDVFCIVCLRMSRPWKAFSHSD